MFGWFEKRLDPFPAEEPVEPPKTLVAFCMHYTRGAWPYIIIDAILVTAIAIAEVWMFGFLGRIVDWLSGQNRETFLQTEGWKLAGMAFVVLFALPGTVWFHSLLNQQTLMGNYPMRIRWQVHRYLLKQSMTFYQDEFAGRIATKLMQTALAVRECVIKLIGVLNYIIVYFLGILFIVGSADWRLAAPLVVWLAGYIGLLRYFIPRLGKVGEAQANARSTMTGRVVDSYSNIQTVKLFSHARREASFAREGMAGFLQTVYQSMRLTTQLYGVLYVLNSLLLFSVTAISLWLWLGQAVTIGAVAVVIGLVLRLWGMSQWIMWEMSSLFENIGTVQDGIGSISLPRLVEDRPGARDIAVTKGEIRFEDIRFHYGKQKGVIENLSLAVKPGEKVGIVGRSGAGKSTLVNLLLRFYDLEAGRILIDGQEIADVTQDSLRAQIGMVTQDTSLLHRSVRENILYGRPDASDELLVEAARRAEALDFIAGLSDAKDRKGFDAHVGDRGVKLSGGQRQRIAIARVMLKDAPILILDEATSALDSEAEAAIQENLYKLMQGKTVIAIAHRLSTIAAMDRLVVMDKGRVIEEGSHEELVARGGLYAQLWQRQSGGFLLDEGLADAANDALAKGKPQNDGRRMMTAVYRWFENWVYPFREPANLRPPTSVGGFLWHYVGQAKFAFFAMLVIGGIAPLVEAGLFYFVGRLVDILDQLPGERSWHALWNAAGPELVFMIAVVLVIRTVVVGLSALVDEQTITPGFYNLVRWQAHRHVSRQSYAFFQNDFAGRIATKVWQAGQATGDLMESFIEVIWFMVVYTVTTLALVAGLDLRLAVLVVIWIAAFGWLAKLYLPAIRKHAEETAEAGSMITGRIVDSYSNVQTLKLFSADGDDRYIKNGFDIYLDALRPFTRRLTGVRMALTTLSGIMITTIGCLAVYLWVEGSITVGAVAFTLSLVLRLNMLLGRVMMQLNGILRNLGVLENSKALISQPLGLTDAPDAKELVVAGGRIDVKNVEFHYGKGFGVLNGIDLVVRPGEKVGLVGPSGAGKTTLANLILRLYDLESGSITIDGQDVSQVTQNSLRANIGVVSQETALFHRSLRDNIKLGMPDATDAEVIAAARKAEAHEFILTLRDNRDRAGYEAFVGERGVKLSGGQRQRVAIARVFLKDAPILILDEATSALDSDIEAAIQENLTRLMENKTVIAIAHRLSTIAALDRLVVLDGGRIVEQGTHDELVALDGLYARLWKRQSGGFLYHEDSVLEETRPAE